VTSNEIQTPEVAVGQYIGTGRFAHEDTADLLSEVLCCWWESELATSVSEVRISGVHLVAVDGEGEEHTLITPCTHEQLDCWVDTLPACGVEIDDDDYDMDGSEW